MSYWKLRSIALGKKPVARLQNGEIEMTQDKGQVPAIQRYEDHVAALVEAHQYICIAELEPQLQPLAILFAGRTRTMQRGAPRSTRLSSIPKGPISTVFGHGKNSSAGWMISYGKHQ